MMTIVMQGVLRDGITTWMPSYVSEIFSMKRTVSILSGVALPVFNILTSQLVLTIYRKYLKNELTATAVFFGGGLVALALLSLLGSFSAIFAVAMMTVAVGAMHGVNQMLTCMICPYFKKYGRVSFVSGMLNACTYVGSAGSMYGIAWVSENCGWSWTVWIWTAVAVAGTLCAVLAIRPWYKFSRTENE